MATNPLALPENFLLAPEAAIKFFHQKGLQVTWDWRDMLREQHNAAFTVAKMMDMDLLGDVRAYMETALQEGWSIDRFRRNLQPELERRGWWGKSTEIDPKTGEEVEVQLGSAYRLNTIYRTNMQSSYAAGRWQQIEQHKDALPYLVYSAIMDDAVREDHAQHNNLMLTVDDPFWDTHSPPNGFNCRCSTIQVTPDMAEEFYGKTAPDPTPNIPTKTTVDPRTGQLHTMPEDIDEGWDYNVGKHYIDQLPETLVAKTSVLSTIDDDMAAAVTAGVQEPEPIPDLDEFEAIGANDLVDNENFAIYRNNVSALDEINKELVEIARRINAVDRRILEGEMTSDQGEEIISRLISERDSLLSRREELRATDVQARTALWEAVNTLWDELNNAPPKSRINDLVDTRAFDSSIPPSQSKSIRAAVNKFVGLSNGKLPATLQSFHRFEKRASARITPNGWIDVGQARPNADEYTRVVYHEIGHHVEFAVLGVSDASNEFLQRRKTQPNPRKLKDIFPAGGYREDEIAYEDKWISPYVGRIYRDGVTEVISMGIENFRSRERMLYLAEQDPEHFKFIVGVIRQYRKGGYRD